jgi:hypothetical protein
MKQFGTTLRPYLIVAQFFAYILVLARIFSAGMHKKYKWFTAYIIFEAVRTAVAFAIPVATKLYAHVYFASQPITWCLYLLVILELYQLTLKDHVGIATLGRRVLMLALSVSTLASLATLAFEAQQPQFDIVRTYVLIERLIVSSLLFFMLLFMAFLAYFPVPVNRNTVAHARIFSCYFLFKTGLLVFRNVITGDAAYAVNIIVYLLSTVCLIGWALLLRPAGEEIRALTSRRSDPDAEERLIAQLNAINRTLLSSAKK